ncbi:DUF1330 domain-containing protein [Mycolicibacterium monacense]|uniref:DUF1330 domain-containing protein n=3 Tax=Mycobacteriaceae TaxID=1762 RepID=A0AAD1MX79_MYCMB|nr:DUF1330 domain-containing protein [Mycolicibacterium monacense]MDA4102960.1 hypothetical protein [Mycolicibacterium monacense DSM 44395]OBB71018.1 hypothetical protein A6B34_17530 [Mycolicibacterium monacense]OBF52807.1 hypothetical protein A5778_12665 [Mycolicibacterium monacense]ORB14365.1 hypothetical protein BST34_23340 [Mycolicibacterium monacense DSM 44395]QHP87295.1 DUF1330 domain-containing protein [Mycolicibacterium monacense DSM 44395]
MPKAYVLLTEDVKDPAGMAEYGKLAGQTMGTAKVLAFGPAVENLEGQWHGNQTVLLEFESVDAAKQWYYSDEYQAAAKLRQAAADCNGVIVSGLG